LVSRRELDVARIAVGQNVEHVKVGEMLSILESILKKRRRELKNGKRKTHGTFRVNMLGHDVTILITSAIKGMVVVESRCCSYFRMLKNYG